MFSWLQKHTIDLVVSADTRSLVPISSKIKIKIILNHFLGNFNGKNVFI